MNQNLLIFFLRNFWRLAFALLGLGLGLLWAFFGFRRALVVLCLTALGFLFGKWKDEGRSGGWLGGWWRHWD